MCGRFVNTSEPKTLVEIFGIDQVLQELPANYNVAPTHQVYVVLEENGERRLTSMRWGLVPSWAKELSFGSKTINARAETIFEKPSFRSAIRQRRCLVLADGYYEWKRQGKQRIPMFIHTPERQPFAMAGCWEQWVPPGRGTNDAIATCTIVTTEANHAMASIHDRMPVILDTEGQSRWLSHRMRPEHLVPLMRPYFNEGLLAYEVSNRVNRVGYNAPDCLEESEPTPIQASLFDF
jgi:putative SOS response-associated peptidase YedK